MKRLWQRMNDSGEEAELGLPMLAASLTGIDSQAPAVVTQSKTVSWRELSDRIADLADAWQPYAMGRVGLCVPADADGPAALAALDKIKAHVFLIDEHASSETISLLAERFELSQVLRADPSDGSWRVTSFEYRGSADASGQEPHQEHHTDATVLPFSDSRSLVTVLTSGTEGLPKAATYTWVQLAKPVRVVEPFPASSANAADVWLLTFRIHLYAGLQVMLQALLNRQTLAIPGTVAEPDEILKLMVQHRVTCGSATPSYWRRLALFGNRSLFSQATLRQITLGGELADQPILDTLRSTFPQARLSHIYATTELGRCFAVTDGRAGFPLSYLAADADVPPTVDAQLRIENGQLYVRSVNGTDRVSAADDEAGSRLVGSGTTDGWVATGDLVEVVEDRVLFAGRAGDMINVGGNKVRPAIVEAVIRDVPGVADVRVFGQASSIAGQLVACDIVVAIGFEPAEVKTKIQAACRASLTPYQAPRSIEFVPNIEIGQAGKTLRQ